MQNQAVMERIQRHLNGLLTRGVYGFDSPQRSIEEGKTWHIEALGVALTRTALLMAAVQLLTILGIEVKENEIIDVDCCHSLVPTCMHVADGPGHYNEEGEKIDFTWVISWCTLCPEGQQALSYQ